jgi:hypothetical protein
MTSRTGLPMQAEKPMSPKQTFHRATTGDREAEKPIQANAMVALLE